MVLFHPSDGNRPVRGEPMVIDTHLSGKMLQPILG